MRRLTLLAGIYISRSLRQQLAWRSFLVTIAIEQMVSPLLGFAVWSAALPGNAGVSRYYIAILVVQLATVSFEHHTVANGIYAGALSHDLLRPHPPVIVAIGENLALRCWHVVIGVPLIACLLVISGARLDPLAVLQAIPALLVAAVIRFLFTYALALAAFWTQQAHGVVGMGETMIFLLGGLAAPVALLPEPMRSIAIGLPFRAMLGFPAEIASGSLTTADLLTGYGWQGLWLAACAGLAALLWRAGVRHFSAAGG